MNERTRERDDNEIFSFLFSHLSMRDLEEKRKAQSKIYLIFINTHEKFSLNSSHLLFLINFLPMVKFKKILDLKKRERERKSTQKDTKKTKIF